MGTILDCVNAYKSLLNTEYKIIIGRKGIATELNVFFQKDHCYHLMGLQYLKDIPQFNGKRETIFDRILEGKITQEQAEKSQFYKEISDRIKYFPYLEALFDSNDTIFKYNERVNNFSIIEADYLMKNTIADRKIFVFLANDQDNRYYCKSFFPYGGRDYSQNQPRWTLLYKEKLNKAEGTSKILYNRYSPLPQP